MNRQILNKKLSNLSLSLFRKDFFGMYQGSISAKTESTRFLINTKEAIFDSIDEDTLIELNFVKDYRWKQASLDANIHHSIYSQISEAKYISFTMSPYITAYALHHNFISPKDYFGDQELGNITIFNPRQFDDWYDRASSEIAYYFQTNKTDIMIIRGYGVYCYNRDLSAMIKKLSILENSCRLLMLNDSR